MRPPPRSPTISRAASRCSRTTVTVPASSSPISRARRGASCCGRRNSEPIACATWLSISEAGTRTIDPASCLRPVSAATPALRRSVGTHSGRSWDGDDRVARGEQHQRKQALAFGRGVCEGQRQRLGLVNALRVLQHLLVDAGEERRRFCEFGPLRRVARRHNEGCAGALSDGRPHCGLVNLWTSMPSARQAEVHDLGAPLSPCLSWRSSSMSASAVMSASSNAPCRSSLSLLSSTSRSHIEVSDLMAPSCIPSFRRGRRFV